MGYLRGLIHGAAIGTVVGLAIAPQPGDRTREQVREAAKGVKTGLEMTGRAMQRVAPVVGPAAEGAFHVVERVRHRRTAEEPAYGGNGSAGGTLPTPTA